MSLLTTAATSAAASAPQGSGPLLGAANRGIAWHGCGKRLLIRDAAYDSIPKEARAAFHERHAAWLEGKIGEGGTRTVAGPFS